MAARARSGRTPRGQGSPSEGRVSLVDEDIDEVLSLTAECGGAPCRVLQDKKGIIRLLAARPGELRLRLDNRTAVHTLYFEVKRMEGGSVAGTVNDWAVLRPGRGGLLERDASTGRAMLVEAARDAQGRVVAEADPRAAETPRTRFTVAVMPAYECNWRRCYWSPKKWIGMVGAFPWDPADGKVWVTVQAPPEAEHHLLPVRLSMTVAELKAAVRKASPAPAGSGAAAEDHQLFKATGGEPLANGRTLAECDVTHGGQLVLLPVPDLAHPKRRVMSVRVAFAGRRGPETTVGLPQSACSVGDLKAKLQEQRGLDPARLHFLLPGVDPRFQVADECSLFYLTIDGEAVSAVLEGAAMRIVVAASCQRVLCGVDPTTTAEDLKHILHHRLGVHHRKQTLDFRGESLYDGNELADYGIQAGSTVYMYESQCGGGGPVPPKGSASVKAAEAAGEEDTGPLVARVVAGGKRGKPLTKAVNLRVLRELAAPTLALEVSLDASL